MSVVKRRLMASGCVILLGAMAPPGGVRQRRGTGETAEAAAHATAEPPALAEARRLMQAGRLQDAESQARVAVEEAEARGGAESIEVAGGLDVLVEVLMQTGAAPPTEVTQMAERALKIRKERLPPDDPGLARSLSLVGSSLMDRGEYRKARAAYEEALRLREATLRPDDPDLAASLSSLGNACLQLGDFARAGELYERALLIEKKVFGAEHLRVARTLNRQAILLRTMGEYARSRPLYERALAITEKALGPDHPDVAGIVNGLAVLLEQTGDFHGARDRYARALAINRKVFGPRHAQTALVMNNLAYALTCMGEYAEARSLLEEALDIRRGALGARHAYVATTLWNLGRVHFLTGDFPAAASFYEQAREIWSEALGAESAEVGTCLHDLATVAEACGDLQEAGRSLERALAVRRKAFGDEHEDVALTLNSLARVQSALGNHEESSRSFAQALAIREKLFGPEHRDVAQSLSDMAVNYEAMRDDALAGPLHERALRIREKILGPRHPAVAESLQRLAGIHARAGADATALEEALRAETIAREHVRLTARTLPERQALAYAATRSSGLDLTIRLAERSSDRSRDANRAWDALVRSRALVLDELAARQRALKESSDPEVARLAADLSRARAILGHLTIRGPDDADPNGYPASLAKAREEVEIAERALAVRSLSFRGELAASQTGLAEVVRTLPPSSAMLAFALTHPQSTIAPASPSADPKDQVFPPEYVAFLARGGETSTFLLPLGPAAEIDDLVARWRVEAGKPGSAPDGGGRTMEADYRRAGEALRRKVWDPVGRELAGVTLLFIVPDGALSLLSFDSLPAGRAGYLVESGPRIHYLSAERDLATYAAPTPEGRGILVIGGPDFDRGSARADVVRDVPRAPAVTTSRSPGTGCPDFWRVRFEPLPSAVREVQQVAALWTQGSEAGPAAADPREVLSLTSSEATEGAFKALAPGRRVLHIATHGFFLEGRCASALVSSRGIGGLKAGDEGLLAPLPGSNPLLLSGLAMAGANRRRAVAPGEDDGILTAEEIAALDLSGVEWAVLSACDTGVGSVEAGEGVFGLRRAFQVAGTRTLIMSLWAVQDEMAREWMEILYEKRFVEHDSSADAVHQASRKLLQRRRIGGRSTHPFFWGAFVAAGDWT